MSDSVRHAARQAETSTAFRAIARCGYVANGLVHILIGVIVLIVALGGDAESDQVGAFKALAAVPLGFAVLWILAIALSGLAAWHAAEGVLVRRSERDARGILKKWGRRISEWGQAVVFAALGVLAASIALGARPDADEAAQGASRGILSVPGGPFVLGAVGLGIAVAGVAFVVMGARVAFRRMVDLPPGAVGSAIEVIGVVGYVAKGVALGILGMLLLVAAVRVDPGAAGGLDEAVDALLAQPYGPALAVAVGVGLIAYGVFCGLRSRFARL